MGRVTTRVRRTRLDVDTGDRVDRTDTVAVEEPLEIRVGDEPVTTTMRTPGDDFDLAIGHLLTEAMLHSHYPLQALLYSVVLHRYLRWRLPGYDPTTNLGGILYLYVRGMCGPETPEVDGQPCGVFAWHPPAAMIEAAQSASSIDMWYVSAITATPGEATSSTTETASAKVLIR